MISTNDLKTGLTVKIDDKLWSVIEFLHVKPGKGSAFVKTKIKNVETGQVIERTFRAGEKLERAMLERSEMQYLYKEGADYVMMNTETYEQMNVPEDVMGSSVKYLKENMNIQILMHDGRIIGIDLPNQVELEVIDTPPAERGNTASGSTKPATLEGGAVVNVPFFVVNGDMVKVDTRTNEYLSKV